MIKNQAPANSARSTAPLAAARLPVAATWRRHVTRRRLRAFVLLSVAAHLALGMSWGVPAYVKQKRAEAEQRRLEALRDEKHRADEAAVAKAKADDLAKTTEEVRERTRKAFDNLTGDLPAPEKEKTWATVRPEVRPAEQHLAEALGDRSMTEQDLRNLQADVDRRLVVAVSDTLNVDAGREEAEAFLAAVEARVVPELVAHYKGELDPKVARPVRTAADDFVKTTSAGASAALGGADAGRRGIADAVRHLGEESDAAAGEVDQTQSLANRKESATGDEIHKHTASAAAHLVAAAAAADAASVGVSSLADRAKPLVGGSDLNDRLVAASDSLTGGRESLRGATTALAADDYAGTARRLTALSLAQCKLDTQWAGVSEAADQADPRAEQAARGALALVQDDPIPQHVDRDLAGAFRDNALPRLAGILNGALRARLTTAGVKADDALVAATEKRLKDLLAAKVGAAGGYGASTSRNLRDVAVRTRHPAGAEGARLAERFTQAADSIIGAGVKEVVADASLDARLAEMVAKPEKDPGRDDVRDRMAMLAARAGDGRAGALDSVSLTELRASAMARSADTNRTAAGAPAPGEPATAPAEGPPVIEEVKKEILGSLHSELRKVLDGKLADEKADKVWDHVAAASDADVNRLSRDLIDPKVSDSELESRRLAFSGKFLDSIREALDKTASADVARELLKQLEGKAGDAVADAYKNAVKENVGSALSREWREAADADGAAAGQQARAVRDALDSARSVAEKSAQLLDRVKEQAEQAERTGRDAKADAAAGRQAVDAARGKLQEINSAVAGAKADVGKAREDLPPEAAEVKARLKDVGKSFDAVTTSVSEADKTGKEGDPAAFTKAVAESRKEVDRLRKGLSRERAGLDREAADARARFVKAARQAKDDSADKVPGVKSRVESKFDGAFRKEALPRLADRVIKSYQQKLEQAGVTADAKDAELLHNAVAAALDKKVTGDAKAGEAALDDLDRQKFFDGEKDAKGEPTKEEADRANAIADNVTEAGVAATVQGDAAGGRTRDAVNNVAGPDSGVTDLKDKVARMQGQIRGGRGGVLADAADGADANDAKNDSGGLANLRRKWQGILAGLSGDGDGNGRNSGAAGATASGGSPGGGAAGGAPGGAGPGTGAGAGLGGGGGGVGHVVAGHIPINEKLHDELVAVLKDRATQQGEPWERTGAAGGPGRDARQADASRPAAILAPASQPNPLARNDAPYAPTFKSLRFAVVPFLNKPLPMGDNFDAWNDIPAAIHLRPERAWLDGQAGLKIVDDLPLKAAWDGHGLYFMLDMPDPDGKISKTRLDNFWQSDCLEVFVDTMNTKELQRGTGAGQQFWYWPFGSIDDVNVPGGESLYSRQTGFHFVALKQEELPRFARPTPNGYQMQCRVPIERVRDADLVPGKILGFNITVETGAKMHYYWSASKVVGTSVHPDTWGDILLGGSDGRVEFPDKLASEAGAEPPSGNAAPAKLLKAFVVGEPLRIRVTDRDMNLNEKVRDKVSVTVRNPRGEQEVAILEETSRDTGVFEGSVRTALALGEHVAGIVNAYEGESLTVTYIDQARANGARYAEIVSRIVAGPSVMADK